MTQDLRDAATPPNMPNTAKFYLMCVKCGRRNKSVRYCLRHGENICQPKCE